MLLPVLVLPFLALARATTYTLNHRHSSESTFTKYGTIDLPEDRDVNEIIRIDKTSSGDLVGQGEGWYQVRMEGEGLGAGLLSSTKSVCPFIRPLCQSPCLGLSRGEHKKRRSDV
jgi:hypothetical protein